MRGARWLAHELVASVTADPFAQVHEATTRAAQIGASAEAAYHGAMGARGRGGRFGSRTEVRHDAGAFAESIISGDFTHGVADKEQALAVLRAGFCDFAIDLTPAPPELLAGIRPSLALWLDFYTRQADGDLIRWATDWSTYQAWWERLRMLRETARAAGVILISPDPPPLPKTLWQRGADGTGSKIDAAISLGRTGAYTVMGIMGFMGLWAGLKSLRELRLLEKVD